MNFKYLLLFGFVLIELAISFCRCSIECPNAPVTPYSILPPVAPNPVFVPTQTTCCSIQQFNTPISNPITNCCCQTNQVKQCCSQSCCHSCSSTTSVVGSNTSCCGSTNRCCSQEQCCNIPPTQPCCQNCNPTTTTPITERPGPVMKCPPGTILIENICHVIYCPTGYQMVNDRCIVTECPAGTVWIGHKCSEPEPIQHNVTFYNTIITQFNGTKQDIILNNVNNIVVNASLSLYDNTNSNNDCVDCDDENSSTSQPSSPPRNVKCCVVMTPRMCENHNNRWQCYSRRSQRCGEFCVAPIIYLKPQRVYAKPGYAVIPPIQNGCLLEGHCNQIRDLYDCSGCAIHDMERCSYYCYRYLCPSRRCDFYDQETYCIHNAGAFGCRQEDGCFDNWCL